MTVPAAAAAIGVPIGTPMSIPWWKLPQRGPNGLVIGPLTGQTSPADDGVAVEVWLAPPPALAARVAPPRAAGDARSRALPSASARSLPESLRQVPGLS